MKIRRLNLSVLKEYMTAGELCLIKPLGSKLHRLVYIPEKYRKDENLYNELLQVLNTLCVRFHKKVYYFNVQDPDDFETLGMTFWYMGIMPIFIETDLAGRDEHLQLDPSLYN